VEHVLQQARTIDRRDMALKAPRIVEVWNIQHTDDQRTLPRTYDHSWTLSSRQS
jgi:hypothetical protein